MQITNEGRIDRLFSRFDNAARPIVAITDRTAAGIDTSVC